MEVAAKAFWSYAHADNEREQGRILRLADLVKAEFELLTGTTIEIFTDKVEIRWGDDFREKLEEALQETAFFIPILTPTYFVRDECRKEISQFVRSATSLGLNQLLLSVRYIPVPDLREESADKLKATAAKMQYEPWDALRLLDEGSAEHRAAVHRLASRLVELTARLESGGRDDQAGGTLTPSGGDDQAGGTRTPAGGSEAGTPTSDEGPPRPDQAPPAREPAARGAGDQVPTPPATMSDTAALVPDDEEPGLLDLVADAQPAMEAWRQTLGQIAPAAERFNAKFQAATALMNTANKKPDAFARKIVIARELARDVEPELQEIEELSSQYVAGLLRIDPTVHAIFELSKLSTDENAEDVVATLSTSFSELVEQARQASDSMNRAADAARANAKLSRDLRPVLRRYETAVRNIADGFEIIEEWDSLSSGGEAA
ncbi:toll/interleukin-1 receptor domain-containing protein [Microbacterium sp. 2FI]|uniref:toll/interleukin-1 receptor domain-containing protein n=1 Tax=Microbacterium sp. 2FI TaxID=2502193 RepID=UPI0010F44376|nr:toll/interleukin-1 receptor domain-containing protein [Microbacterium sp. 2FI]